MIPLQVRLNGAIGIKAGLGLDALEIDLRSIPDNAVTVAIRGDNGSGKSTLMNLGFVPWREPPHLVGSVYEHFDRRGTRELVWSHDSVEYRTLIEYRDRTQRAFLHVNDGYSWQPVTMPDNTASDGKTSTYDACLASILGPRDLYYLSAFRSQGAPLIGDRDPKRLMRSLLGL